MDSNFFYRQFLFVVFFSGALYAEEELADASDLLLFHRTASGVVREKAPSNEKSHYDLHCDLYRHLSSHFSMGGNYTYVHMKPNGIPSFHGHLGGAQIMYEYQKKNRIYAGIPISWTQGNTQGANGNRFMRIFDGQERIGYSVGGRDWMISLFTGVAYRRASERLKEAGSEMTFRYNLFYVPVGMLIQGSVTEMFYMGLNLQWMPQILPMVAISTQSGAYWSLTYEHANFRGEIPFTVYFGRHGFSIVFTPFFERWKYGHTTAKTQNNVPLGIPSNNYLFGGGKLDLRWSF